jgi:hypothetical protein
MPRPADRSLEVAPAFECPEVAATAAVSEGNPTALIVGSKVVIRPKAQERARQRPRYVTSVESGPFRCV